MTCNKPEINCDYIDNLDLSVEHKFNLITEKFPHIDAYDTIVDLGCGSAKLTNKIASQYPQALVYGLENSDVMYNYINNSCIIPDNTQIIKANVIDKKFNDDTVKIFYISSCCHEVKSFYNEGSIAIMFKNIYDSLREDGKLIIRDFVKPLDNKQIVITKNNFNDYVDKFNNEFPSKIIDNTCDISTFYEFAIHTKYVDNWESEIKEHYAWINAYELSLLLTKIGFNSISVTYEYNSFINSHINENFEIIDKQTQTLINMDKTFPTHMLVVASK